MCSRSLYSAFLYLCTAKKLWQFAAPFWLHKQLTAFVSQLLVAPLIEQTATFYNKNLCFSFIIRVFWVRLPCWVIAEIPKNIGSFLGPIYEFGTNYTLLIIIFLLLYYATPTVATLNKNRLFAGIFNNLQYIVCNFILFEFRKSFVVNDLINLTSEAWMQLQL